MGKSDINILITTGAKCEYGFPFLILNFSVICIESKFHFQNDNCVKNGGRGAGCSRKLLSTGRAHYSESPSLTDESSVLANEVLSYRKLGF